MENSFFLKNNKGSFTIEAVILIPTTMVIAILLIYIGLYLHDRSVSYGYAYEAAFLAVQNPDADNSSTDALFWDEFTKGYQGHLVSETLTARSQVDFDGIRVHYEGYVPVGAITDHTLFWIWQVFAYEEVVEARRHKPVTFIRQCRKLEKLAQSLLGEE